jgi:hypothetical protein
MNVSARGFVMFLVLLVGYAIAVYFAEPIIGPRLSRAQREVRRMIRRIWQWIATRLTQHVSQKRDVH